MSAEEQVRLWLGWRARHLTGASSGWQSFTKSLASTFIPVTWEIMTRFGLRTYVPSVFSAAEGAGPPEEIALLCYRTRADYDASKATVLGRAYGAMHRAVFEFEIAGRKSRADWAAAHGARGPVLRSAADGGVRFDDAAAVVHVLLLSSPGGRLATPALLGALTTQPGSVAVWCESGFAAVWIAAPSAQDMSVFSDPVLQAVPHAVVTAFHCAQPAPPIDQTFGLPVVEQHSWQFMADSA